MSVFHNLKLISIDGK